MGRKNLENAIIPGTVHQQQITIMDFGNDIPDYDPDDFDNYDYE